MLDKNRRQAAASISSLSLSMVIVLLASGAYVLVRAHEGHRYAPASARNLKNPVDPSPSNIDEGRAAYVQNCAVCHGENGKGDDSAISCLAVKPTDLTGKQAGALADGEIFWEITHGIRVSGMPSFAAKVSTTGRWQIVDYVRQLALLSQANKEAGHDDGQYTCPMHRDLVSNSPGKCPKCGMKLVARDAGR